MLDGSEVRALCRLGNIFNLGKTALYVSGLWMVARSCYTELQKENCVDSSVAVHLYYKKTVKILNSFVHIIKRQRLWKVLSRLTVKQNLHVMFNHRYFDFVFSSVVKP